MHTKVSSVCTLKVSIDKDRPSEVKAAIIAIQKLSKIFTTKEVILVKLLIKSLVNIASKQELSEYVGSGWFWIWIDFQMADYLQETGNKTIQNDDENSAP